MLNSSAYGGTSWRLDNCKMRFRSDIRSWKRLEFPAIAADAGTRKLAWLYRAPSINAEATVAFCQVSLISARLNAIDGLKDEPSSQKGMQRD
jgi:hypothetical protein